jgi:hypothetical protein
VDGEGDGDEGEVGASPAGGGGGGEISEPIDPKKLVPMSPGGLAKFQKLTHKKKGNLQMTQMSMESDWVNDYLVYLWPGVCVMVENLLKTKIGPSIQEALPASMRGSLHVGFAQAYLGKQPFRLDNFAVSRGPKNELDIHVDVSIRTASSTNITVVARLFGGSAAPGGDGVSGAVATADDDDEDKQTGESWWRFASPKYWVSKVLGESGITVSAGVKDVSFLARVAISLRPLMPTGRLCYVLLLCYVSYVCYVLLCYVSYVCYVLLCYVLLCFVCYMLCYEFYVLLCYVMLCMLCYLCYATYVLLCMLYVMLCMLCYVYYVMCIMLSMLYIMCVVLCM